MPDYDALAAEVIVAAKSFVERSVAAIGKRLDEFDERLKSLPVPEKGDAGKDGAQGEKGEAGNDGKDADIDLVRRIVAEEVTKAVALIPKALDGRDGMPGLVGRDGVCGADGKDGADGFSLDDFDATLEEDGRTITLKFSRGELVKECKIKLAVPLDKGVFRRGNAYEKGDTTTWDGSAWIAQRDTEDRPGSSDAWRLAVKHGQDGKDFSPKSPVEPKVVRLR